MCIMYIDILKSSNNKDRNMTNNYIYIGYKEYRGYI